MQGVLVVPTQIISYFFHPEIWGKIFYPIFDSFFSTGLVQPATRGGFVSFIFMSLETSDAPFWANFWNRPLYPNSEQQL